MSDEPLSLTPKPKVLIELHRQFDQRLSTISAAEQDDVRDIVDSLHGIPDQGSDYAINGTNAGDLWVRRKANSYVMYTYTRNDPESKFLVKCWVCGKFVIKNGKETYDIA
ncbi:hypothetical protein FZ983_00380 [Azospirillum sp. B21]|uniref:hypothetical protein n=1 Tax=Azospirillum sp. B21 TaxID=2607496 RepID=UPI0011EF5F89|nr:hypothetical protein [Azospirillum sp. B21]KAA0583119.1 hypothetical protein FZ983_00380 [Azospirillum sp. B21]